MKFSEEFSSIIKSGEKGNCLICGKDTEYFEILFESHFCSS